MKGIIRMKIALDAGHGGSDAGAVGKAGTKESVVNLAICKLLADRLMADGHSIIQTRPREEFVTLSQRCIIANTAKADIFVSVHCNSDGPSAVGVETLYKTERGRALAEPIQKALLTATGDVDRGLKLRNDLAVLNGTSMPACLAEVGFISHPDTEQKLRTASYQQLIANAICNGIIGTPPTPPPNLTLEARVAKLEERVSVLETQA